MLNFNITDHGTILYYVDTPTTKTYHTQTDTQACMNTYTHTTHAVLNNILHSTDNS